MTGRFLDERPLGGALGSQNPWVSGKPAPVVTCGSSSQYAPFVRQGFRSARAAVVVLGHIWLSAGGGSDPRNRPPDDDAADTFWRAWK